MRVNEKGRSNDHSLFSLIYSSDDMERDESMLTVYFFGWYWYVYFNTVLIRAKKAPSKSGGYTVVMPRRYGFSFHYKDDMHCLFLYYGSDDDNWESEERVKSSMTIWNFPWAQWSFDAHYLLNLDGTLFHKVGKDDEHNCWDYPGHETISFNFLDGFDGTPVIAKCKVERRVWTKGEKSFGWLKYLFKDNNQKSLDLDFNKEVGKRKGSWKGGITGMGTGMLEDETPEEAFVRFCLKEGHKYKGKCDEKK